MSHIMSLCHDLGTCTWLTGGCYIVAIPPRSYDQRNGGNISGVDIPSRVANALATKRPTSFAAVPWVLEGLIDIYSQREDLIEALRNLHFYIAGGARASRSVLAWSREIGLPVVVTLGMTEVGGEF